MRRRARRRSLASRQAPRTASSPCGSWPGPLCGRRLRGRARFDAIAPLYDDVSRSRRLRYWRARCLEPEGHAKEAHAIFAELAQASTPDLYARFARNYAPGPPAKEGPAIADPSTATASFARVDELLRLRLFVEASAECRTLASSRGRDLRLAQSDFALGRFLPAAAAIKRALPEIGTAEEGRVPDGWRRLYYPIEEGGFLAARAKEFDLDPGILRGLVRQESVFDATAKSRAGATLMQLMPPAKSLARPRCGEALPPRVPLRSRSQRATRCGVPAPAARSVRQFPGTRARGLQRRPDAHRAPRAGESRQARGRALRIDSLIRDPRLRSESPVVRGELSGALPLGHFRF